ncbi:synaptotagmin-5 isoform X1 [Colletes gigas]|uniref:synaptotagmin-5 isoform X1 n=1 Tax=Colletes gigas TaxID=935657 RepID=UPI001C9A4472|nr:synaptotagmin-5 isoform X1 [Colletes gigas]
MDVHGIGIVAVLGTVGAATGAISAVIVYTICIKRKRLSLLVPGRGPLNWFEKDLLNRAEETLSSKDNFVGLGSNVKLDQKNKISEDNDDHCNDEEWQSNYAFDSIASDSSKKVLQYLSESEDISISPVSSFAPLLPEGAVAASEKCMVIVKSTSRGMIDSHSRLNSTECETSSYKLSSSSSMSLSDEIRGELQIGLIYDASAGILTVRLVEAHDLHPRELNGTADPYGKVRLLPDWSNVWQTRIHRRTLNPVFDEDFVFEVMPESLTGRTLEILLYDFDAFSRHYCLGHVQLPLSAVIDLLDATLTLITKPILRYSIENGFKAPSLGELMVSLSYQLSTEKLTIIVVRAKNLPSLNDSTNANLYVKVKIVQDGKSIKKKRSSIQRETISPVWNDILSFDINNDILSKCMIEFIILRANGELLAKCEVSNKCQKELFQRVLSGKGASAQWLPLSKAETYCDDFTEVKH